MVSSAVSHATVHINGMFFLVNAIIGEMFFLVNAVIGKMIEQKRGMNFL